MAEGNIFDQFDLGAPEDEEEQVGSPETPADEMSAGPLSEAPQSVVEEPQSVAEEPQPVAENVFDQFDGGEEQGNIFDQFDPPESAAEPEPETPTVIDDPDLWDQFVGGFYEDRARENFDSAITAAKDLRQLRDGKALDPGMTGGQFSGIGRQIRTMTEEGRDKEASNLRGQLEARLGTAKDYIDKGKEIPFSKETQQFLDENSENGIIEDFWAAPWKIISELGARSGYASMKALPAGVALGTAGSVAGPVGSAAGFALGMGGMSARTEYAASVLESMQEQGVDPFDVDQLIDLMSDEEKMDDIQRKAATRAVIIGGVDALTGGVAGKQIAPSALKGRIAGELVSEMAQMGIQSAGGASGEALAQLVTEGEVNLREVAAEAAGELVTAPVEVAGAVVSGARKKPGTLDEAPEDGLTARIDASQQAAMDDARARGGDELEAALAGAMAADAEGSTVQSEMETLAAEIAEEEFVAAEAADEAVRQQEQQTAAEEYEAQVLERERTAGVPDREEAFEMAEQEAETARAVTTQEAEYQREIQTGEQIEATRETEATRPTLGDIAPAEITEPTPAETAEVKAPEAAQIEDMRPSTVVVDAQGQATEPLSGSQMDMQIRRQFKAQDVKTEAGERLQEIPLKASGMDILIENPKGSTRTGTDRNGNKWSVKFKGSHYGKIKGVRGADNESLDVFVGSQTTEPDTVWVIDQLRQEDGTFDEHKVMLGFNNQLSAVKAYKQNHQAGWKVGPVTQMTMDEFKAWAYDGERKTTALSITPEAVSGEADVQAIAERQARKGRKKPKVLFALPDGMKVEISDDIDAVLGAGEMNVELVDNSGEVRGGITADVYPEQKEIRIAVSKLDDDLHGKKIGLEMYNHLLKEAADRGFDVTSDRSVSGAAVRVYEALERRGATVIRNPNARDNGRGDGGLVTDDIRNPVFTIKPTNIRLKQGDVEGAEVQELTDHDEVVTSVENALRFMPALGEMGYEIQILRNPSEAPFEIAQYLQETNHSDAKGAYDNETGTVYVFTDNTDGFEDAMGTFMHEAVAHKGLRVVLGDELTPLMNDIWKNGNQNAIKKVAKAYSFDVTSPADQRAATEEYIAALAERVDPPSVVRRVIDAVRAALREMGVLHNWTDNDIRNLLRSVRGRLNTQTGVEGTQEGDRIVLAKGTKDDAVAEKISAVSLLDGTETLEIPGARIVKKTGKLKADAKSLARALVNRTLKANRGRALDSRTPRTREIVAKALALETEAAMQQSGHAGDWYSTVLHNAVSIAAEIHPELKTNQDARAMFLLGLAITSNGLDVSTNSAAAEQVYAGFKGKQRFPNRGYGDKGPAMTQGFEQANSLIEKWGLPDFVKFLNTEFTVGELNQLGFDVSGEGVDHVTYGSVIFGPKIGGGFYQNLMGNYSPITIDRWFMRTWGRLTGTLLPDTRTMPDAQATRLANAIQADRKKVVDLGYNPDEALESDATLLKLAQDLHRSYARSGFKEKTEIHMAGKNLDIAMRDPIIAPRSGGERAWIREVSNRALDLLAEREINVNAASMQALVWYPEKDLYLQYGVGNAKSVPTDYEQEFAKLASERGISESRIEAARTGDTGKRPAGPVGPGGLVEGAVEETAAPRFGKQERQHLLQQTVTRNIRQQLPRPYKPGSERGKLPLLDGIKAKKVYKPEIKTKNAFGRVGMASPEFLEMTAGPESAALFHRKITEAKVASPAGAAVYVYPQEEYENMRTFLDPTGKVGFALNGDDIVSLFKFPSSDMPNAAQAAVGLAVAEGGRRLDAFDTVLPSIYSLQGFKVVARMKWDPEQAPADWNKREFSRWNDGEPDVVFMAYDGNRFDAYTGQNEGELTNDYDRAVELQMREVDGLAERNKKSLQLSIGAKKRIDADPSSPLARLHKMGATVEAQAEMGPAHVTRNMLSQFKDHAIVKTTLSMVPRRNLSDFLPKEHAPSLDRYIREANRMTGRRNELVQRYEEVARSWAKWTSGNKRMAGQLSEVMHASTLAGVDPSKKYTPLKDPKKMDDADKRVNALRREQHIMLKDAYDNRLDDKGRELFTGVRDSYIEMRKDLEEGLMARIENSEGDNKTKQALMDKLRKQFESGRVSGPYFPLMRYGDRWASAKDADGEVVAYSRFENREDQRDWVKEFKASGYAVEQGKKSDSDLSSVRQVSPDFVRQVTEAVGDKELQDEIWQIYLQSLPELSMRKRFLHRKGRLGFAADALRAYANVAFRSAHQQAKLEYMHVMKQHLDNLRDEAHRIENNENLSREFEWAMPVYDEMVKRHEAAQNPNASAWSTTITGLGFQWFLGWTPAAAAVNFSQMPLVALPVLAAKFGVPGAMKEMSIAIKQTARTRKGIESALRGDERKAFDEANRIGLFEKTQAHDLAGVTEIGMESYGGKMQKFSEAGAFMFHTVEQLNRRATFLAGYRLARQRDMSHDDAVMLAEDMTWDSHFDYNNDNRPVWMQNNIARVITLFKQYSLNMTYRMLRDFNDSIRGQSAQQKKEARVRFSGMMLMGWAMTGFTGLPAVATQLLPWLVEALFSDEDDPFDAEDSVRAYLAEQYGPKAAEVIMKGPVDAFTPVTLSSRVSLSQLWWRDPSPTDDEEAAATKIIMDILGPIPSTALDISVRAPQLFAEGHMDRGFEKMTPKILRDLMRAYRYNVEGAKTMHTPSDTLLAPEDFTMGDLVSQAAGFTPSRLTMQYEQNAALRGASKKLQDRRTQLLDHYVAAVNMSDKTETREAWDAIERWNKKQPTLVIDSDTLQSSIGSRYRRSAMSRGGVTLPTDMYFLYKDLSFTPEERPVSKETEEE